MSRQLSSKQPRGANISSLKFIILSVVTLGIYQIYWAWRLWEMVRLSKGETYKFKSSLRALFTGIGCFWLFPRIINLAEQKGHKSKANITMIAALYFVVSWLGNSPRVPLAFLPVTVIAQALIPLPIVKAQNYYMAKTRGKFAPTKTNWWLIVSIVVIFILFAVALGAIGNG